MIKGIELMERCITFLMVFIVPLNKEESSHMHILNILYLVLMGVSFVLSLWCYKHDRSLKIISLLLSLSLLTEAVVYVLFYLLELKPEFFLVYHLYIPLEYMLLSYYFSRNIPGKSVQRIILFSILLFFTASFSLSYYHGFYKFPGYNLNLEGSLIILWTIIALFNIPPSINVPIFALPVFWISLSVLIYYTGSFSFNFVYQYFIDHETEFARSLNGLINKGLNYILYISFSIAFLCSNRLRKYTLQ